MHWSIHRYQEHKEGSSAHHYRGIEVLFWRLSHRLIKGLNLRWRDYEKDKEDIPND